MQEGGVVVSARREVEDVLHNPDIDASGGGSPLPNGRLMSPFELEPTAHEVMRAALTRCCRQPRSST